MKRNVPYVIGLSISAISVVILLISYDSYAAVLGFITYVGACMQDMINK